MNEYVATCEQAARLGGGVLRQWRNRFTFREKGPSDPVTDADLASQEAIERFVQARYPHHAFLGEESVDKSPRHAEFAWIVDPLDGTTNYVHGLPNYAVSVALLRHGGVIAGAVYDPLLDECFSGGLGLGARMNGHPIRVSGECDLGKALVAVSLPALVTVDTPEVELLLRVMPRCQGFRRMGSAALNLAYVACGRLDAYWSTSTFIWDIAAGVLLVREAGGVVTAPHGGTLDLARGAFVSAATPTLHRELLQTLMIPNRPQGN